MQGSSAQRRLTISMIMVVIAFLAIAIAGAAASYRDRNRPDFMLAIWCTFAGLTAWTTFSQRTSRALAEAWGKNLATLGVYLAGELWMGVVFTPLPAESSVLHHLIWNYWPPLVAFPAGLLGGYLARYRYGRLHPDSVAPPIT